MKHLTIAKRIVIGSAAFCLLAGISATSGYWQIYQSIFNQ
jgi:hypothetical protein